MCVKATAGGHQEQRVGNVCVGQVCVVVCVCKCVCVCVGKWATGARGGVGVCKHKVGEGTKNKCVVCGGVGSVWGGECVGKVCGTGPNVKG